MSLVIQDSFSISSLKLFYALYKSRSVGWGLQQSGLEEGVPACGKGVGTGSSTRSPSNPNYSVALGNHFVLTVLSRCVLLSGLNEDFLLNEQVGFFSNCLDAVQRFLTYLFW